MIACVNNPWPVIQESQLFATARCQKSHGERAVANQSVLALLVPTLLPAAGDGEFDIVGTVGELDIVAIVRGDCAGVRAGG